MRAMPRPRKPFVQREVTRHGKTVWYFRRGKEKRIRLPGAFGSREFNAAYDAAVAGKMPAKATGSQASLRWLVEQYYASGRFSQFRPNTQRNHRLMLESVCETGGDLAFREIGRAELMAGLMRRESTPNMATAYVTVMRGLFEFAKDSGWVSTNPVTIDIKARPHSTEGFHTWTEEEVAAYQARHPVGTQARLAMDLLLFTGLRRADAIVLGRQHVRSGRIHIRAGKNGAELVLPLLAPLARSIEATKTGDMVFLLNTHGRPWKHNSFGYWFADRCIEAGILEGRAHGLRKAGATMAADGGATEHELMALYGWSSARMAEIYTRKANRTRLAERAANRLSPHILLVEKDKGAGHA